jgi:hypothetical protein
MRERLLQVEMFVVGGLMVISLGMGLLSAARWIISKL